MKGSFKDFAIAGAIITGLIWIAVVDHTGTEDVLTESISQENTVESTNIPPAQDKQSADMYFSEEGGEKALEDVSVEIDSLKRANTHPILIMMEEKGPKDTVKFIQDSDKNIALLASKLSTADLEWFDFYKRLVTEGGGFWGSQGFILEEAVNNALSKNPAAVLILKEELIIKGHWHSALDCGSTNWDGMDFENFQKVIPKALEELTTRKIQVWEIVSRLPDWNQQYCLPEIDKALKKWVAFAKAHNISVDSYSTGSFSDPSSEMSVLESMDINLIKQKIFDEGISRTFSYIAAGANWERFNIFARHIANGEEAWFDILHKFYQGGAIDGIYGEFLGAATTEAIDKNPNLVFRHWQRIGYDVECYHSELGDPEPWYLMIPPSLKIELARKEAIEKFNNKQFEKQKAECLSQLDSSIKATVQGVLDMDIPIKIKGYLESSPEDRKAEDLDVEKVRAMQKDKGSAATYHYLMDDMRLRQKFESEINAGNDVWLGVLTDIYRSYDQAALADDSIADKSVRAMAITKTPDVFLRYWHARANGEDNAWLGCGSITRELGDDVSINRNLKQLCVQRNLVSEIKNAELMIIKNRCLKSIDSALNYVEYGPKRPASEICKQNNVVNAELYEKSIPLDELFLVSRMQFEIEDGNKNKSEGEYKETALGWLTEYNGKSYKFNHWEKFISSVSQSNKEWLGFVGANYSKFTGRYKQGLNFAIGDALTKDAKTTFSILEDTLQGTGDLEGVCGATYEDILWGVSIDSEVISTALNKLKNRKESLESLNGEGFQQVKTICLNAINRSKESWLGRQ